MAELLSGVIDVELRPDHHEPLTRQLYAQLRSAMLSGALPAGSRLPSSRELARQLQLSRNTVSYVIDQLAMEGYLDVSQGRRPTVAQSSPTLQAGAPSALPKSNLPVSRWADQVSRADWPFAQEGPLRPFAPGVADAREFPHDVWARCLRRAARGATDHGLALSRPSLQRALLTHLTEHRGVKAEAGQIIITPSAQAAIELVARVVLNAGDIAWVESPGYGGARAAFDSAGAAVHGVKLDDGGLSFKGRRDRPRLIFVTPSHQYPSGGLMPISRRQQLLAFAGSVGAGIIEDDYDSEFHYDGRPVAALQGLDTAAAVFYVGTFSKSTFADIRAGYAIIPAHLTAVFDKAQRHTGQIVSAQLQDALADFIDDGYFAAHIRKMTRIYRGRRDCAVQALRAAMPTLRIDPPAGGMQLLIRFDPHLDDVAIAERLHAAGVMVRALSRHYTGEIAGRGLFVGFAAWNEREIEAGANLMRKILRPYLGDV